MTSRIAMALAIWGFQALCAYILLRGLRLPARAVTPIIVVFIVMNLPLLYILWLQAGARQPPTWAAALIVRPAFAWQFNWLAFLVFIVPVIGIVRLIAVYAGGEALIAWLRAGVLTVIAIWTLLSIYGLVATITPPRIVTQEIVLDKLPPGEDGLVIAHLSDSHVAWWTSRSEFRQAARLIEEMKPDLLVVTGDMVDHHPDYVYAFADCLKNVKPRLGRYAIIGNHDVYTGRAPVANRMTKSGFRMLRGEWTAIEGSSLLIAGLDDSGKNWTTRDPANKRIPGAVKGAPPDRPLILLKHRPFDLAEIEGLPVDLVLSGHTHGGQIRLPLGGPGLADLTFKYVQGFHQQNGKKIYVTRGTGTVGWPFRLFCPPEVSKIVLRSPLK